MNRRNQSAGRAGWKTALVVLAISLLIHQSLFWALALAGLFKNEPPQKPMEVALMPPPQKTPMAKPPEKQQLAKKQPIGAPPKTPVPTRRIKPIPKPQAKPSPTPPAPLRPAPQATPLTALEGPAAPPEQVAARAPATLQTKMNWGTFQHTMGARATSERTRYDNALQAKRGGSFKFGRMSAKVKKALSDHRSWIAGAPKLPPGTRTDQFHNYLESTHEQIHALFADSFLPSLVALGADNPLNNFDLNALLEFQILADGTINEIHVLRTSGQSVFDAAAVDSLYRASPFLPPPKALLSYDNRVYFRWGFYRNQRKCGTFNATGYILTGPGDAKKAIPDSRYNIIDG